MDVIIQIAFFHIRFQSPDPGKKELPWKSLTGIPKEDLHKVSFPAGQSTAFVMA